MLLVREGGLLRLAKYGLTLPNSMTTVNTWMRKLRCTFDRVKQSYYTDGHEQPDVEQDRGAYVRRQRKIALRKQCWQQVEWLSLSDTEQKAFNDLREMGEDACSAETYHFGVGGKKHIEFHADILGGGSDEGYDALREG